MKFAIHYYNKTKLRTASARINVADKEMFKAIILVESQYFVDAEKIIKSIEKNTQKIILINSK